MFNKLCNIYARFFAKKRLIKLNNLLFYFSIRGLGMLNHNNFVTSGENNFLKQILKIFQNQKAVLFDIGANEGKFTTLLIELFPDAIIYCFEPHPGNFSNLKKNLADRERVKLYNLAVSDKSELAEIFDYEGSNGTTHACMNSEAFTGVHRSQFISHQVKCTTLDEFVEKENIQKIDFVKIDVEGNELKVLNGAKKCLENGKIRALQFEFTQLNVFNRVFFKDFYDLLSEKYILARLMPDGLLMIKEYNPTIMEVFAYQNYVALTRDEKWEI